MLRRTFARLFSLSESRSMFLDSNGTPLPHSSATLNETLHVLAAHSSPPSETPLVHAALDQLMRLDATDADSKTIAAFSPHTQAKERPPHLTLRIMATYPNDAFVRERCCRCIANMCQLQSSFSTMIDASSPVDEVTSGTSHLTTSAVSDSTSSNTHFADVLVSHGAVELALGTLSMTSRLSRKGRAWSALSVLNLLCLSKDGVPRAAAANAEAILADFIRDMAEEHMHGSNPTTESRVALDAALGALTRLLTSEVEDNAAGVQFRYECAALSTMEAVARALIALSVSVLEEVQSTRAAARTGTLFFPTATPNQQAAILAFLPPLHKAWMALKNLSSHKPNVLMVYEALHAADGARGLRAVLMALQCVGVQLEGLCAVGAVEEARLQRDLLLYAMESLMALTAPRSDLSPHAMQQVTEDLNANAPLPTPNGPSKDDTHTEGMTGMHTTSEADDAGLSAVIPTEAALMVSEVFAAGTVTDLAVATIVRIYATQEETTQARPMQPSHAISQANLHSDTRDEDVSDASRVPLYPSGDFDLLTPCLLVLVNLSSHDVAVASPNTMAALLALLQGAEARLTAFPHAHKARRGVRWNASPPASEQSMVLQQCVLLGHVYAALWGTMRTKEGASAVREMRLRDAVQRVQDILEVIYTEVVAGEGVPNDKQHEVNEEEEEDKAEKSAKSMRLVEETMRRLLPLGRRVLEGLDLHASQEKKENGGNISDKSKHAIC